jgi:hypothetical protein
MTPEDLLRASVPGEIDRKLGPGPEPDPGYALVLSELDGRWYVTFLEFYDPETQEAPRAAGGAPPTPEGVAITYRAEHGRAVEAGEDFGEIFRALLEEARQPEERVTGMARVEEKIRGARAEGLFRRRYGDPELRGDPDYAAALDEEIEREVPDPERREFLDSFERFRHGFREDQG